MRVLDISGSLRRDSYNTALLRRAGERFDDNGRLNEPNLEQEVHEVITTLLTDAQSAKTSPPGADSAR
jgi:NAD(P)H-dependent FMN reductase